MALYDYLGNILDGSGNTPLSGKSVLLLGDSNSAYIASELKVYMETNYGCRFTTLAEPGQKWETENGVNALDNSAVGRVNSLIADITDGTEAISAYDYIVFMFGTNSGATGNVTDGGTDVSTMCGAMKYCMKKMAYYGRKIQIGIVIPFRWVGEDCYEAQEMPEKFREVETIAKMYSVPTLNLFWRGRIIQNSQTISGKDSGYLSSDVVHLSTNGKLQFKHAFGKWIAYEL